MATEASTQGRTWASNAAVMGRLQTLEAELAVVRKIAGSASETRPRKLMKDFRGYWVGKVEVSDETLAEVQSEVNRGDKLIG